MDDSIFPTLEKWTIQIVGYEYCICEQQSETMRGETINSELYSIGRYRSRTAKAAISPHEWGIIDNKGDWIIPPVYYLIKDTNTGIYVGDELSIVFDRFYYGGFDKGFYVIINEDEGSISYSRYGFYHIESGTFVEPYWAELYIPDDPLIPLLLVADPNTGLYGYIDKVGNIAIECKYTYAQSFFQDGYAIVVSEENPDFEYLIDLFGNRIE